MKNVRSTLTRSFSYLDSHFQRYNSFITFNTRSIGVKVERRIIVLRFLRSSMNDNNYCFREYYYYYVIMLIIPISNSP